MRITKRKVALFLFGAFWVASAIYFLKQSAEETGSKSRVRPTSNNAIKVDPSLSSNSKSKTDELVVPVCLTGDSSRIGGMISAINSVQANTKHHVKFYLVTDEKNVAHLKNYIEKTSLRNIDYTIKVFNEDLVKNKVLVRGGRQELASPLNYARFYISEMFPELSGRLIHLDDDTIVQGDIAELYKTHIEANHVMAVSDDCSSVSKRFTFIQNTYANYINFNNAQIKKLHMSPIACAFNTGVYVADLTRWKKQNITAKIEYWMKLNTEQEIYGNEKGGGGSQPPMMIALYKKYTLMDPMWHVRNLGWSPSGKRYSKEFLQSAKLLHWNGRFKPWGRKSQAADIWDKYFIKDPEERFRPLRRDLKRATLSGSINT
ncbi:unnamed protein product [Owenia fusiformis]|uniref:Glycosyltransferase 8 domain-containing protein 1 n=1 Tax=Owenia fusiformis TaxID=6347 RepID=A0A8S4N2Z1_OWEFU|nr:unnamed protein product [Owenia fusiformis]